MAHEVSILLGIGRHRSQPRAKVSITIMRAATWVRARQRAWRVRGDIRLLLLVGSRRGDYAGCGGPSLI
jgi:hypothetical protein